MACSWHSFFVPFCVLRWQSNIKLPSHYPLNFLNYNVRQSFVARLSPFLFFIPQCSNHNNFTPIVIMLERMNRKQWRQAALAAILVYEHTFVLLAGWFVRNAKWALLTATFPLCLLELNSFSTKIAVTIYDRDAFSFLFTLHFFSAHAASTKSNGNEHFALMMNDFWFKFTSTQWASSMV